ncbi:MAG TPA: DNA-protecting protein DprA [Phycisphaerales bacterium]|nr:DNA-protecting protein DprA [Phycisphaerales bacterium]
MEASESLRAALRLHLAEGVGAVTYRRLIEAFGGPAETLAAGAGQWRRVEGVGEKTSAAIAAVTDEQVDEELAEAERRGARILCQSDADFPAALRTIYDCPAALYVLGELHPSDAVAVGVVGSRRCTHYGQEQSARFGQLLGRAGFTVVSGGARGIDAAAHRGALDAGGRTVAVMGCGLASLYPPENAALFGRIVDEGRGAIVSELPMRTAVLGGNFPTRNRIISGLSLGVLVVEAARRSGSLHTARESAEQGRVVFALPGRVDSSLSQGTNDLIRNGAILVQNLDDLLEHLGEVGEKMQIDEPAAVVPHGMDDVERKLYAALEEGSLGLDELVRRTGIASGQAASAMTMLVLKGAVVQRAGNVFARQGGAKA